MEATIRKVGNSLGVIIPSDALKLMGLGDGDTIRISIRNKRITLILSKK